MNIGYRRQFQDINIYSAGSFILTASSSYSQPIVNATLNFSLEDSVSQVTLVGPTTLQAYDSYEITVTIYGGDEQLLLEEVVVSLEHGGFLVERNPIVTDTGKAVFKVLLDEIINFEYSSRVEFHGAFSYSNTHYVEEVNPAEFLLSFNDSGIYINQPFSLNVTIENFKGVRLLNVFDLELTLESSNSEFPSVASIVKQGNAEFSGLVFNTKGEFILYLSCGISTIKPKEITIQVTQRLGYIQCFISSTNTSTYFTESLTILLQDTESKVYNESFTVEIQCWNRSEDCLEYSMDQNDNNSYLVYFKTSGLKLMEVIVNSNGVRMTQILKINVQQSLLKFGSITLEKFDFSTSRFSVTVSIYDSSGEILETMNGPYLITVMLIAVPDVQSSGSIIDGDANKLTDLGIATFNDLSILSTGHFRIQASSLYFGVIQSEESYYIANKPYDYEVSSSHTSASIFENITLHFNILGDDKNAFILPAILTFNYISDDVIGLQPTQSRSGLFVVSFYCTAPQTLELIGVFTSKGSDLTTAPLIINITNANFSINFERAASNVYDNFTFTISIVNSANNSIRNFPSVEFAVFLNTIDLNSTEFISDSLTNGEKSFTDMMISTAGTYFFTIISKSSFINSFKGEDFSITTPVHKIVLSSVDKISTYQIFTMSIFLFDENDNFYDSAIMVTLSDSTLSLTGNLSLVVLDGFKEDSFWFTSEGKKNIAVTSNNSASNTVTTLLSITVYQSKLIVNFDPYYRVVSSTEDITYQITIKDTFLLEESLATVKGALRLYLVAKESIPNTGVRFYSSKPVPFSGGHIDYKLQIYSVGVFSLCISGYGLITGCADEIYVAGIAKKITFKFNNTSPTVFDIVNVVITVWAVRNYAFTEYPFDLSISSTMSSDISGLASVYTNTGIASINLQFNKAQTYDLYSNIEFFISDTYYMNVTQPVLEILLTETPLTFSTVFNVYVKARHDKLMSNVPVFLELICQPDAICSGTSFNRVITVVSTYRGISKFKDLQILSSGLFYLRATAPKYFYADANITDLRNEVKYIDYGQPLYDPTLNFKLIFQCCLLGSDERPYLFPTTLILSEVNGYLFHGKPEIEVMNGNFSLELQLLELALYNFTVTLSGSNYTENLLFDVQKLNLNFLNPPKLKYQLGETVLIKAAVYDHSGTKIEMEEGNYTFIIDISPAGNFSRIEMSTFQGIGNISLTFRHPGLYIISALPQENFNINPTSPILITESATKILFNAKDLNQTASTLFAFNITLLNYYGDPFNYNNSIVFFCADGSGKTADGLMVPTKSSNTSLLLYFLSGGKKTCSIVATNSTTLDLDFIVDPMKINQDEQCEIAINNLTCFKCVPQAVLKNGTCSCVESSYFNSQTKSCECEAGLVFNNSKCLICANYYYSEEISAYFSPDYQGITVSFLRPVDQKVIKSCNSAVLLPKNLRKYSFVCFLIDLYTLVINFNVVIPTDNPVINLNPKIVQAAGSRCEFDMKDLAVTASLIYEKPSPIASIAGPSSVSLGCNPESVVLTSKHASADYTYNWSANQASDEIYQFLSIQKEQSVAIPSNILNEGSLIITLTITSLMLNTTNSDHFNLTVTSKPNLSVVITAGTSKVVNRRDALQLKASILDICRKSSDYTYQWTYSTSPNDPLFSFRSMSNYNKNLISLSIYPYSLNKGITYSFTVAVSSSSITGLASISIAVASNDLNIVLNRSSGTVGTYNDLIIQATIDDIDNECSLNRIISVWSCTSENNPCLDSENMPLIQDSKQSTLKIAKARLKNLELYHFQIKATCSMKLNSTIKTIDIRIDNSTIGDISIASINSISDSDAITVIPSVKAFAEAKFLWTVYPSVTGLILDQPFLYIPSNALEPARVYLLTLTMYRRQISDGVSGHTNLEVIANPVCQKLEIVKVSNNFYEFTALGCQNDNQLRSISYSYGYYKENDVVWATKKTLENPMRIFIGYATLIGVVKVCYGSNSCSIITSPFPKSSSRRLEMDLSDYEAYAYDPENVPSLLMFYSNLIKSQSDYQYLYKKYIDYYGSTEVDESLLDVFLDSTIAMINNSFALANITKGQLDTSTEFLKSVIQGSPSLLTATQIKKILRILTISIDQRGPETINEALELISIRNSLNTPLNFEIYIDTEKIGYYRYKNKASGFSNKTIVLNDAIITIKGLALHNETIYDLFFSKCLQDILNYQLYLYEAGQYKFFNYFPTKPKQLTNISLANPISITIYGNFSEKNLYICLIYTQGTWIAKGCSIVKINSKSIEINLMQTSSFKIVVDDRCYLGMGPIVAMGALIFLIVVLYPALWNSDRKVKNDSEAKAFFLYYPMISLFFKQPDNRRSIIALQLLVSELLVLTLIGGAQFYFDSTNSVTTNSFHTYSDKQLYKGAVGFGLAQIVAIPLFVFNILLIKRKVYIKVMITALIIIIITCVSGLMVLSGRYCEGWSDYWISNFAIFLLFDLLVVQVGYAAVLSVCIKSTRHTYVSDCRDTGNGATSVATGNVVTNYFENRKIVINSEEAAGNDGPCDIEEEKNSEESDHLGVPNVEESKNNEISHIYLSN